MKQRTVWKLSLIQESGKIMEEGRPSTTAIIAAMTRASHLFLDDDPKIFQDPLALGLSGMENEAALRATLGEIHSDIARQSTPEFAKKFLKYNRANITLRQRYAEDELGKALERGVKQYVILGAGLDSFAYRRPDLAAIVRVFEVDHPSTQEWKRARLQELNVAPPGNLTFVPIDFERQTLVTALRAGGHQSELPTFVSWLGVTMYLTEAAIFETLRYVASLASGSEMVLQYYLSGPLLSEEGRRLLAIYKAAAAARGEPWLTFFEPTDLGSRVKELGFSQVEDLGPEDANAHYFADRTDGLCDGGLSHHIKARV
jgi:methyltransferase (TIGR00027 family)